MNAALVTLLAFAVLFFALLAYVPLFRTVVIVLSATALIGIGVLSVAGSVRWWLDGRKWRLR